MRVDDPKRYLEDAGRPWEVGVGIVVAALASLFLWLAGIVIVGGIQRGILSPPIFERGKGAFLIVPGILLALGLPGAWIAFRLISGRKRKDGGLMSPLVLRVFGVLLIATPWLWVLAHRSQPWHWLHLLHLLPLSAAGIACFLLAARRERRDALDASISTPGAGPIG